MQRLGRPWATQWPKRPHGQHEDEESMRYMETKNLEITKREFQEGYAKSMMARMLHEDQEVCKSQEGQELCENQERHEKHKDKESLELHKGHEAHQEENN